MAFVDYTYYQSLYGASAIDLIPFNRIIILAEKIVCDATTGVDGICKLKVAFPTVQHDAEIVKRCICEIVNTINKIEVAESNATDGKVVESVTAGNETIKYAIGGGLVGAVLSDRKAQTKLLDDIIDNYLTGIRDNNNINLLFKGIYPYLV